MKTTDSIVVKKVAALMYPKDKFPQSRLATKLSEKSTRGFTKDDTLAAIQALKTIGAEWDQIDGFKD